LANQQGRCSMHDEQSFLQAMHQHPEDNALRLVFADWLEERGDKRGELIRLLHTLTQAIDVTDRAKLEERLRALLAAGVQPVGPFWTNSIGMRFAWIPAGTFMMGSPESEEERMEDESQHPVTLSKGFSLAIHPVTQATWRTVTGRNANLVEGDDLPAVGVADLSWEDCQKFLRMLSDRDGHTYRLPTEAEWEYACRAGTTTPFYFGETILKDQANYGRGFGPNPGLTSVGSYPPNAFGLHDMHGNVWEYCQDWYGKYPNEAVVDPQGPALPQREEDGRVYRGGVFRGGGHWSDDTPGSIRSARRFRECYVGFDVYVGFRPVRTFP
jgi:uncharacterized protein (TIGR02996 family)